MAKTTENILPSGEKEHVTLHVNGEDISLLIEAHWTLSKVLRNGCSLTGTKEACDAGACGACTVLIDGIARPACMLLAREQVGKKIETIEGLEKNGQLHPIQEAWLEEYGAQCGFCSPGFIMTTKALLAKNPNPNDDEIKEALGGNLCLCDNYEHIILAVKSAAKKIAKGGK